MNGQDPVTFYMNRGADLTGFRQALRSLIFCDTRPELITWRPHSEPELFGNRMPPNFGEASKPIILPRAVGKLIETVVCHSEPEKYPLLYDLVWRMKKPVNPEPRLMEVATDPLVARLNLMAKSVARDIHKMHAFLRFREGGDQTGAERFIAWFEPDHFIVEATAKFFVDRFTSMDWTILTPKGSLWWDKKELCIGPPASRSDAPEEDAFEVHWRTYYESTFNPVRTNLTVMKQHMPRKYWKNMSETRAIPGLVATAASRVEEMIEKEAAMPTRRNPDKAVALMEDQAPKSLEELNKIIKRSDPFIEGSDKAVLGEGPMHPKIAFVGEQPGDQEDLQGRPFVGPAGKLLDKALEEAGIDRSKAYITNAVKHFKYIQRGKHRLHQTPTAAEVKRYRWWLQKELDFVKPDLVVGLGATAVHALAGHQMPIGKNRGPAELDGRKAYITVHPSFLLRVPDEAREKEYEAFVADLKRIRRLAA
ncbi:MAG TPA: UdgX family uracil-DNA binding protein [Hyphomonadaceae bacterium]|jgi:DNA polymerase|nr:UdgX family uracil-DNA binding protein [Hyphomonadaceae bacterium]